MATTLPPPDHDPDDDLIAYLDGELDDDAAEAVESKLANDPDARTRADEYKKSFGLLDYLPKSEPSSTFATRTITRLMPAVSASGSQTTPTTLPRPRKVWPEVMIWGLLAVLATIAAFAGSRVWRQATTLPPADLPISDLAVIESLPLYAGVDDIDFLRDLAKVDLFDADSADAVLPHSPPLSKDDRERLIEQFRSFTPARQQQLRTLHQKLNDPTNNDRVTLLHTLEAYAVWLSRLPDTDRRKVLDAAPGQRPEVVRQVSERRWRESLAQRQQDALKHTDGPEERLELLQTFRAEEADRRQEWEIAQRQWKEADGRERPKDWKPWPFDQTDAAKQVDEYIKSAFGVDPKGMAVKPKEGKKVETPPASCRLTPQELTELYECREAVGHGERWFSYGVLLLKLSEKYPTLPKYGNGKPVPVNPRDVLGISTGYVVPKEDGLKRRMVIGKWPDFAEEVARANPKEPRLPPLGPAKPDDFTEVVKKFATDTLPPKLTQPEKDRLKGLEGKWPEYPREMWRLAREKNLSMPEVMLPGEPNNWKKYYGLTPPKK